MFPRVRFSHVKTAAIATWKEVVVFFKFFWLGIIVLFNWAKGFSSVNDAYRYFIPKIIIIIVGTFFTGIPFYFILPLAFLPWRFAAPVLLLAFIVMFAH